VFLSGGYDKVVRLFPSVTSVENTKILTVPSRNLNFTHLTRFLIRSIAFRAKKQRRPAKTNDRMTAQGECFLNNLATSRMTTRGRLEACPISYHLITISYHQIAENWSRARQGPIKRNPGLIQNGD
jgi:hypothetical protein